MATTRQTEAFIGIGSNLDDPGAQVRRAIAALGQMPGTRLLAQSSLYRSAPLGQVQQPDFINAVAKIETDLDVTTLFRELQAIENRLGRIRIERWGPRVIDLDLLVFGDRVIDEPDLQVPHPGMADRNFVLLPLREIAPDLDIPGLGTVADIAANDKEPRITRIH